MGRILSIDYGASRVGIAVSDPMQMIANGLSTVETRNIWIFLADYFKKETVEQVIIGYPIQNNGTGSDSLSEINPFIRKFIKLYPDMPISQVDERFTSRIAMQAMIAGGVKKKGRQDKGLVDKVSATIILQDFLNMHRTKK